MPVPTFEPFNFHWYVGVVPPFVGVAMKVTEAPAQIVVAEAEILTLAGKFGLTTILLEAVAVPQDPPLVVNINVIGVVEFAAAVKVAVFGVLPVLFANVPLDADQTAAVAPPP